jgi:hypothetical protein
MGLYSAYFIPNSMDPSGMVSWSKLFKGIAKITIGLAGVAGGVVATGGTGGGAAPLGAVFIVSGVLSVASGFSDFTQAFTDGDIEVPSSLPGLAAMVIVSTSGTGGTATGQAIEGAGEIVDLFTPNGLERVAAQRLIDVYDVVDHVQTISEKAGIVKDAISAHRSPGPSAPQSPPSPAPNAGSRTISVPITLRGTATLKCKDKFQEHLVRSGDTLWDLWRARSDKSIPWAHMVTANKFLKNIDYIHPGDYVCAPCGRG